MGAADQDGPVPDPYRRLGVARDASPAEISAAWRRRARAEHPDARPGDPAAPGGFRAVAEAWQVLGDPARRAAYDRSRAAGQPPAGVPAGRVRIPVRHVRGPAGSQPPPGQPLRAGPVRAETPHLVSSAPGTAEEEFMAAIVAHLASRYPGWPW